MGEMIQVQYQQYHLVCLMSVGNAVKNEAYSDCRVSIIFNLENLLLPEKRDLTDVT